VQPVQTGSVQHRRQQGLIDVSLRPPGGLTPSSNSNSQEFIMHTLRTLAALSVAVLLGACASPGAMNAASPSASTAPMAMGASGSMAAQDSRIKAMQDMHQKMVNASTPAERQALMADHMKAMQGGMAMMKEMQAKHGAGGMGMMGSSSGAAPMAGMGDGKGMATDMSIMQMMMDMMADRMPPASTAK
jgi:hypothetical protein